VRLTESYLSRVAQRAWPDAVVTVITADQTQSRTFQLCTEFRLERSGADARQLGKTFYEAQAALVAELRRSLTTSDLRDVPRRLTGQCRRTGEPTRTILADADLLGAIGTPGLENVACVYPFRTEAGDEFERICVPTSVAAVDYCCWVRGELGRRYPNDRFELSIAAHNRD
jgi:hypothetical protein